MSSRKTKRQIVNDDSEGEGSHQSSPKRLKLEATRARANPPSTSSRAITPDEEDHLQQSFSKSSRREPTRTKKRKHVDEDEENAYNVDVEDIDEDLATVAPELDFSDESTYSNDEPRSRKKGRAGPKTAAKGSGAKGKVKPKPVEEKAVLMKDERKTAISKATPAATPTKRVSRPNVSTDTPTDTTSHTRMISPDAATPTPSASTKKRLPTIKKNKDPAAVQAALSAAPHVPGLAARKQLQSQTADVDLMNSGVYAELFNKAPGAVTPRSGISRADERRAELAKMRQEARAKREVEQRQYFNLQLKTEKVLRYEEMILKPHRSSVLYPNILGAKWKEEYDRQMRRTKEANGNGIGAPLTPSRLTPQPMKDGEKMELELEEGEEKEEGEM